MKRPNKFSLILILGFLTSIGPFSIDMYLPGFPDIAADLSTTVANVSLSLSSFFIGISAGQLLYGPLLDRFGRKPPLYFGLSLYMITSVSCAFATSVNGLIVLRFLQALSACGGMVASRAMVRDIFPVKEIAKVFSLLMLVIGVSPIIAPTLGGYVTAVFGWHYVFIVLALLALLILLAVYFVLPESKKPDYDYILKPEFILKGYLGVLKEPQFYTYVLTGSIASAGLYTYIAGSPYVFMELYKLSEKQYGWLFSLIAAGLITSSQLNTVILRRYNSEQIIKVALFCQSFTGIALITGSILDLLGLYSSIFLIFIFLCCQGFIFPNSSALSLAPFSKNAGSASALMGAIQMGIGTIASALVSFLNNNTTLPMMGIMAACALCSFSVLMIGNRIIRSKSSIKGVEEETSEMIETFYR